ncbi:TetR family transcriptional regulator [Actinocatenispora thailandica]|uniref:TetR family transcriptional regulator n=1 Tax=Actinocatenispora thailandica TaxID=227318 RepID=A0A7R7DQX4_9ACTN|nr:TetR/AcrR family transcriptional regulator [Actinocatenispora thailandica]BCJ36164.1 TetR family transcriptional regulator [Actinocatenispora thailandica]
MTTDTTPGPGRRGQAARNDAVILDAAREVFLADPKAPVSAVAKRAEVGISALYRRYPSKDDLLRTLCENGLRTYLAEAEAALAEPDAWAALTGFLTRVVDADVHSLTVRLAGRFTPTEQLGADARRAGELAGRLVDRARRDGRLRPDVVAQDLGLVLEGCAAIRLPDPDRTGQLRRRYLGLLLAGLAADTTDRLPGPPPNPDELNWRWRR